MHDPAFERLGLRLAGPEDERVAGRVETMSMSQSSPGVIVSVDNIDS